MAEISLTFTSSEIENLCRTCLSRESELYSLFNTHIHTTTLNHIITEITGIEIEPNDDLPKSVCCECRKNATIAFEFKKKSEESAGILKNYLKIDDSSLFKVEIKEITQSKNCDVKIEQNCAENDDFDIYNDLESLEDNYQESEKVKKEQLLNEVVNIPFQCNICSTILDSGEEFSKHLKNSCLKVECHDAVESFCPLCGICFDANKTLTKHMWDDHAELMGPKKKGRPKNLNTTTILNKLSKNGLEVKPVRYNKYCCLFCEKSYSAKEDLVQHVRVHKDDKVYCCIICKKMYLNFLKYKQHFCLGENNLKNENINGASTDLASDQHKTLEFLSEISYENLLSACDTPENVSLPQGCSFCSEVFVLNTDFLNHIDSEHPELSQRCNICLKVFASVKAAARHRGICKTIERKHECSTCGLKFVYELTLNKHILRYHEGQSVSVNFMDPEYKSQSRNYECDICNKGFRRKATLAKHTKIHTTNAKIFECDVCKRTFNRKDNLKSHKTTHEPRSPSKNVKMSCLCVYCGRSFNNSSNLIVHVRRHTGEKPYKCDFCGKGFPRSSDLQCHRRSHTGEKPCECKICGKSFSRSNKLTRHMRIHTGQKPYQCHFCDKAFSQSNDLTLHVRRHTGDKPYICEVCGDRFIQGTALQNHRRAHGHFPTTSSEVTAHSQQLVQSIKTINYLSSDNKLIQE